MFSPRSQRYPGQLAHHMLLYLASLVALFARTHSLRCQIRPLPSSTKKATSEESAATRQMERKVGLQYVYTLCSTTHSRQFILASIGRRSWKMFYATLRDLVLYLHKDEHGFRKSQQQESFANSIRIHHSIASVANDYPKKKFVFRLVTVDNAEFLFETRSVHLVTLVSLPFPPFLFPYHSLSIVLWILTVYSFVSLVIPENCSPGWTPSTQLRLVCLLLRFPWR